MIVVAGSGLGFVTDADQMHFTYQNVSGDVDIVARFRGIVDAHPLATGGIMVRGLLDADASYAALASTSQVGRVVLAPARAGLDPARHSASPSASWFKLERRGALVSAFVSEDGSRWEFVGSDLVNLDDRCMSACWQQVTRPALLRLRCSTTLKSEASSDLGPRVRHPGLHRHLSRIPCRLP